jgi:hypothetical protein
MVYSHKFEQFVSGNKCLSSPQWHCLRSMVQSSIAMFKDCQSGGYNLEDSKASVERLTSLVLLIALAYTCAGLRGQAIKSCGQQALYRSSERIEKTSATPQQFLDRFVRTDVDCCPRIL